MNSNKLVIGLAGNDEIREYLAKKSVGDECSFDVTGKIDEMTPDQVVLSVTEANLVDGEDDTATDTDQAEEGAESGKDDKSSMTSMMAAMGGKGNA